MGLTTESKKTLFKVLKENEISYTLGWTNYMETVKNSKAVVIEIKKEEEIQLLLKTINKLNNEINVEDKITVRATAGWSEKYHGDFFSGLNELITTKETEYNESFSFSQVVGGMDSSNEKGTDIIIRFNKKFHKLVHEKNSSSVEVSAGVQISDLSDFLRKNNLSLPTVSMISWVTAVGLCGTGGHGTGRDQTAFSGLIEKITVCDINGDIREIDSNHKDFNLLCGAHSGLLGIVLSVKLNTVKAFNLKETIDIFSDTEKMQGKLSDILEKNEYVSIMGMPVYGKNELEISTWQIRKWNKTKEKPKKNNDAPYHVNIHSVLENIETKIGSTAMDYLLHSDFKNLMPIFMLLAAEAAIGTRGTSSIVDHENNITHPVVNFPKKMRDVSYLIPIKDSKAGTTLEKILLGIEHLLQEAGKKGQYPVTYAIYVRYIKGTNGGLSTTYTNSEDERILAIDVVTNPDAPGIKEFEKNLMTWFKKNEMKPRHHLGKNMPEGINHYDQFLDSGILLEYKKALQRWYTTENEMDGADELQKSPFLTSYLKQMLSPSIKQEKKKALSTELKIELLDKEKEKIQQKYNEEECVEFLKEMLILIKNMNLSSEKGKKLIEQFIKTLNIELLDKKNNLKNKSKIIIDSNSKDDLSEELDLIYFDDEKNDNNFNMN